MTMKKILCICMALILALGCAAAFAEEDLQAQLDAANAKIAELQAQVDAYYPYYQAQIVATYGEDGIIWLKDAQANYEQTAAQYASMGLDLEGMGMAAMAKQSVLEGMAEEAVILAKAAELGFADFDEEKMAQFEADAKITLDYYLDYYLSYNYPDAENYTDEMLAEAEAYWAANGIDLNATVESYKKAEIMEKIEAHATQDVAVTEEDIQAAYTQLIEDNKAAYADDATYNSDRSNGVAIAWNPEGYRAVKHVLVKFNDEQAALYSELQAQLDSLNAEKEAIENPTEETEEAAEEAAPARKISEVNADIVACATEVEALYTQLLPTAEEVIAKFNDGVAFEELIAEYNQDPGMNAEPTASQGYAVREGSTYWDPAFTAGAMSIAEVGGISKPVYGSYGIHIIYYMADIPTGEVALEEIHDEVELDAYDAKYNETYAAAIDSWKEEMNLEFFYENFGIGA